MSQCEDFCIRCGVSSRVAQDLKTLSGKMQERYRQMRIGEICR